MAQFTQSGFKPARTLDGSSPVVKTFRVSAGDNIAYFVGDAVTLGATGRLSPLRTSAENATGVIVALEKVVDGNPAPLTFNQPSNSPFLATAQEGFAKVIVGSQQTFTVEIDKAITEADIGAGARVSAGTPNTAAGHSGQSLQGAVATSANDAHFQIVGLAPDELTITRTSVASPALVEVIMSNPTFTGNLI